MENNQFKIKHRPKLHEFSKTIPVFDQNLEEIIDSTSGNLCYSGKLLNGI